LQCGTFTAFATIQTFHLDSHFGKASEDGNAGWMVGGFNGFRHRFRMTLSPVKRRRLKLPELYSQNLKNAKMNWQIDINAVNAK